MLGDRSRERRRMAAECLAASKLTTDFRVRASLVEMAKKWHDLAERSEHGGSNAALGLLEAAIGQELRALFEPPQILPPHLLTLLMQFDAQTAAD